jgi:hypothetical protein
MTSLSDRSGFLPWLLCSGLLFFGVCGRSQGPIPPPVAPGVTVGAAPAESTSFGPVTAQLDAGGSFYLYLSAAQWLAHLSGEIAEWRDLAIQADPKKSPADIQKMSRSFDLGAALVKKSGIEAITGVGASSLEIEPGIYRNTLFVHHFNGQENGFLGTLFGTAPHALTGLDFLPGDTAAASFGDCDVVGVLTAVRATLEQSGLPEVKEQLANGLTQFASITGMSFDDFLQSLGGSSGLILTLDPHKPVELPGDQKQTIPFPRLAVLIEVKDDRIFDRIGQTLAMFPAILKTGETGLRMFTMEYPVTPQFSVRATVARWDKYLILASDDQLVRDISAAQKSGQGFKTSPAFAKLSAGLPAEGNSFSVMTQTFVDAIKQFQSAAIKGQPGAAPGQAKFMQKLFSYQATGPTYGVSQHIADGWLFVNKGPQNFNSMVAPLIVAPAAIAVGFALPGFHAAWFKAKPAH